MSANTKSSTSKAINAKSVLPARSNDLNRPVNSLDDDNTAAAEQNTVKDLGQGQRRWHIPFALKLGVVISMIAIIGAMVLAYLSITQHLKLLERQSDAFGETIVEQLAGSLVEPVFTDDQLAIQLQLNQLAKKSAVYGVALYLPNGDLMSQSGSVGELSAVDQYSQAKPDESISTAIRMRSKILPAGHYMAPVFFSDVNAAYAVVSINRSAMRMAFYTSTQNLIIAVVVICFISILSAYIFSRMLSRPIYRLLAISKAAREGRVQDLPGANARSGGTADWSNEWADILSVYAQLGNEVNNKREVEKLLQRFVASDVADQLLNGNEVLQLGGEVIDATVLFVDIVEYTRMSESMEPGEVARMLNKYLSIFTSCARVYRGTVDKFIGDAAMIVFGAPRADVDHRLHAMACAHAIQTVAQQINQKRKSNGLDPINLRVGVNSGQIQAGILGSEYRMEYTVVGDSVNLASRLCDAAEPGEALVSESVYNNGYYSEVFAESAGTKEVKGKEQPVKIYRIRSVSDPKSWMIASLIDDIVTAY
jgi:adenylate cyclase